MFFNDAAAAENIDQFFPNKDTTGFSMAVKKAKDCECKSVSREGARLAGYVIKCRDTWSHLE